MRQANPCGRSLIGSQLLIKLGSKGCRGVDPTSPSHQSVQEAGEEEHN